MGRDCSLVHQQSYSLTKMEIVSVVVNKGLLILYLVGKRRFFCR